MSHEDIESTKAPLMDHLIELRARIIRSLYAFLAAFLVCFFFSRHIYNILTYPYVRVVGPEKAMIAAKGIERRRHLRMIALATGLGDKSVSLVYESALRKERLELWVDRCEAQIKGALDALEKERAAAATPYLFGERIGHSDDGRDDYLCAEQYYMFGNFDKDTD